MPQQKREGGRETCEAKRRNVSRNTARSNVQAADEREGERRTERPCGVVKPDIARPGAMVLHVRLILTLG